jgi:hypothetical protein
MVFEALYEAAKRGELLLVDGGMCRWHLRRDGVLVIREIIAVVKSRGTAMLATLKGTPGARQILAKCPADLEANEWYGRMGFRLLREEMTPSRRWLKVWALDLLPSSTAPTATPPSPAPP